MIEQGVIRVKFTAAHADQVAANLLQPNKQAGFYTGINDFDTLLEAFAIANSSQLMPVGAGENEKSSNNEIAARHRLWGFHQWFEFELTAKSGIDEIMYAFSQLDCVEIVEPVFRVFQLQAEGIAVDQNSSQNKSAQGDNPTNDPRFSNQWSLLNQTFPNGADISAANAWKIETGKPGVVVAIVDGGIQYNHADLSDNMWRNESGQYGYNFADDTFQVTPNNHATHVAGIIAAVTNNETGIAGIAGGTGNGDGVRLMSMQVFSATKSKGFHLAPVYAADNGAAILQNSWVYGAPGMYDHLALDAIDYFNTYGGGEVMDGGITIFAAGNNASDAMYYPAAYEGVIAVASTDRTDRKASSSNYGDWVDISAPGVNILSTLANNAYGNSSGTSMASPHVSGVIALLISKVPGMLTASEVKNVLLTTADNIDDKNPDYAGMLGSGRLNAFNALKTLQLLYTDEVTEDPDLDEQIEENEPVTNVFYFVHDGNWEDVNNWYLDENGAIPANEVPQTNFEVNISANCVASGTITITANQTIILHPGGQLTAPEMTISESTSSQPNLIIQPLSELHVIGKLTNNKGHNAIRIIADERGSGSLLNESPSVEASYELRYFSTPASWAFLSVPSTSVSFGRDIASGQLFHWSEPDLSWIDIGSIPEGEKNYASYMAPGEGLLANNAMHKADEGSLFIHGTLNQVATQIALSSCADKSDNFAGFNLLGNPFPSNIDWNASNGWNGRENLQQEAGQAHTMWVWNPETGNYGAYNSKALSETGTNNASRYIAPLQAFWVKADRDKQSFTMNNEVRVSMEQTAVRQQAGQTQSLQLMVSSDTNSFRDEIKFEFGHNTSEGGAEKMYSILDNAPSLFTTKDDTSYSISFLRNVAEHLLLPVGFEPGDNGQFTISLTTNLELNEDIYLIDSYTGSEYNLTQNSRYSFYSNVGDDPYRFLIRLGESTTTSVSDVNTENPEIYFTDGNLHIENPWENNADVQVFSISGAKLLSLHAAPRSASSQKVSLNPGVYIVRMTNQGREYATRLAMW